MAHHCSIQQLIEANPDFQMVKSWYENPDTEWYIVDSDLKRYREKNDKPVDWYPSEKQKEEYLSFLANYRKATQKRNMRALRKLNSKSLRDTVEVYKSMLKLGYTRQQLDARLDLIKSYFTESIAKATKYVARKRGYEMSLTQAIESLGGYQKIMNKIFDTFSGYTAEMEYNRMVKIFGEPKDENAKKKYEERAEKTAAEIRKIAENRERFASLAARTISDSLGLVINHNGVEMSLESVDSQREDENDAEKESNGGSGGDRFVDVRLKHIMETLSTEVRSFLSTIPIIDSTGRASRNDLLRMKYLDPRQIAYILPDVLRFSTPETMIADLKDATDRYPFLQNLVSKLEGKYNKADTDVQAMIYTNFKRAANLYGYIERKKGKYDAKTANTRAHGNAVIRSASVNMGGSVLYRPWSMYDDAGMLRQNIKQISDEISSALTDIKQRLGFVNTAVGGFDNRKSTKKDGTPTNYKEYTKYSQYAQANGGAEAMELFLEENQDVVPTITNALRGIGIDVSEYQVRNAILSPVNKATAKIIGEVKADTHSGTNRLDALVDNIISMYKTASRTTSKDSTKLQFPTARAVADTTTQELARINSALGVSFFDELENRVLINGSSAQTYVYPSLLHDVMDALNNEAGLDEANYRAYLDSEYLSYLGYSLHGKPLGWLKKLYDGSAFNSSSKEGSRVGPFKLIHLSAFNHVEYIDLSTTQKIAAQLTMWGNMNHAVEVPIQADYTTAWDFIQGCNIGSGIEISTLDDIVAERFNSEIAAYKEQNGKKPSLQKQAEMRGRITDQVLLEHGFIKKADGTYHTDWEVVEELADEVIAECNRISVLSQEDTSNGPHVDVVDRQGLKFQIFPEFNTNGFWEKYIGFESDTDARDFVKEEVAKQLEKVIDKDFAYLEKTKALSNPTLERWMVDGKAVNIYAPSGKINDTSASARLTLQKFFLDYFYGRLQMVKLINGGMQNFDGLLDFEKRSMMDHATRRPLYTEATWEGKKVGRSIERAMYLEDEISESAYFDDISEMLTAFKNEGHCTERQLKRMIDSYKMHNSTDGQAFRTYESYRVIQIELGKWSKERERIYNYLVYGKGSISDDALSRELARIYNPNEKPVYTGWADVRGMKVPVLHKYSEAVLFPPKVLKKLLGNNIPPQILGLSMAAEKLNKPGQPFDIFLFKSCVKVGCHSTVNPFDFLRAEDGEILRDESGTPIRINNNAVQIADYIVNSVDIAPWCIHELPMKYYGEAASTPAHGEDDEIAWSSQAWKDIWGNISSKDTLSIGNTKMSSAEARDIADEIDAANAAETYKELQGLFDDPEELRDVLKSELAGKPYSSPELEYALDSDKVPFFYPAIARGAEQLFLSIIKKRMTRPRTKGANLLQVTSFGWDEDAYHNVFGNSKLRRPRIVFEGTGSDRHLKYIEAYSTINDSRLEVFADETGAISPERLQKLVDQGIIPEEILYSVAYRTPSDEMHSILPIRIIGFLPKTMGANMIVPKEAMKMTGHDFDGDKLRNHYIDFEIAPDNGYIYERFLENQSNDKKILRDILDGMLKDGDKKAIEIDTDFKKFRKEFLRNPDNWKPGWIKPYAFDIKKPAAQQSRKARNNGKVRFAFAQLTSVAGSHRIFVPGGSAETDVFGAAFHITRSIHDNPELKEKLSGYDIDFKDDKSVYASLVKKSGKELAKIMNAVNGDITPYSFSHSVEAYEYMIGGKRMISIYALYASAGQMLQHLGLRVNQRLHKGFKSKQVEPYRIGFFGKPIDTLYDMDNFEHALGTLTLSEGINSAVDNGKNPRLGYLNQDPKLAEITNYLVAANYSAEQVHLLLNQPVIVEAVIRMKDQKISFYSALSQLREELAHDKQNYEKYVKYLETASDTVFALQKPDWADMMPQHYADLVESKDEALVARQISLLTVLMSQWRYASLLANFIKGTRPEASSDGIGTTISETIVITDELQSLRDAVLGDDESSLYDGDEIIDETKMEAEEDPRVDKPITQPVLIEGLDKVIAPVEIYDNDDKETIVKKISRSPLMRVTALEALMQDTVFKFLAPYFPFAKEQWRSVIQNILGRYRVSKREKETIIRHIGNEMVTFNLLQSSAFSGEVREQLKEEQKRMLINFPHELMQLKSRISDEKELAEKGEPAMDVVARSLVDNNFLRKLTVSFPKSEHDLPRIYFEKGGIVMDNFAQKITYDWAQMSVSTHEEIKKLAIDLFKYNAFAGGFGFGMYEFSHFAPYTVLEAVQGYLESLRAIRDNYAFTDNIDSARKFFYMYYMNHWQDERLVPRYGFDKLPNDILKELGVKLRPEEADKIVKKKFGDYSSKPVILIQGKSDSKLFMLQTNSDGTPSLTELAKLSKETDKSQLIIQYNPFINVEDIESIEVGTDSVWGNPYERFLNNSEAADISGADDQFNSEEERKAYYDSLATTERTPVVAHHGSRVKKAEGSMEALLSDIAKNVEHNDAALAKHPESSTDAASRVVDAESILNSHYGAKMTEAEQTESTRQLFSSFEGEEGEFGGSEKMAYISRIEVDEKGEEHVVTRTANWTPDVVKMAREQKAYYLLNKILREQILPKLGVGIGALTKADAILHLQGVTDFATTQVTATGLRELIRLAEGFEGEEALPEEFAHLALEMLGHDHPLVKRLLEVLRTNENAMKEAYEGQYEEYKTLYKNDADKLALEAAGKLLSKAMLREQEIETREARSLIGRIIDAIKDMFRKVKSWFVTEAILDANSVSSQLARDILSGRILDDMSLDNISIKEKFYQVQKDVSGKKNIVGKLIQTEVKRLALLQKRAGPTKRSDESPSVVATRKQIEQLESAIRNHKVESAVYDYMLSSLQFLKDTESSLDTLVAKGGKANSICRKLNAVRDTLYSYSSVLEQLDEAIETGELVPSVQLQQAMNEVRDEMNKFLAKYNRLGMRQFEGMLKNVYGEHGVTRTVGRHKGETISIHDMARRGDKDISLITRLISSIADCGDYVLAAFDDITRNAKTQGRARAAEAHRRVLVAFDKLEKATGSKDQSFIFETERGEDGKMHRTGFYISEEKAKRILSAAQFDFYKEMMAIKQDIDACLPPAVIKNKYQIIALRKYGVDRIKDADGVRGKLEAFGENMKNSLLDTSEDADNENIGMLEDFGGNKIDTLPLKYTTKGESESWDDMTDDVALSVVAYASMGYEYDEVNQVLAILENARYMSMNREIEQSYGWKKLVSKFKTGKTADDFTYEENYTKKQMYTNLQWALDQFFQMHLYGKLQKEEGSIMGTKLSKRKVSNAINAAASYTQMAFNLQQRISNIGAGAMNIAIETAGKGVFNAASFSWGTKIYMAHMGKRLFETGKMESDDKLSLFAERFDLHQNNGKFHVNSFKTSYLSRVFNTNLMFAGLQAGEDFLALTTALAIAHETKVKNSKTGKIETLWDAYDVVYTDPANKTGAYLMLNPDYTMEDGSPITSEVERKYQKLVIGTNFRLQGIYNSDDKSAIHQYAFGSLVMMYRKWIHPALVRRYGSVGYNPLTGEEGEGYWRTFSRWIADSAKGENITEDEMEDVSKNIRGAAKRLIASAQLNWSKLTDYEKSNVKRALMEMSTLLGICLALMLHSKFGPDKDQKEKDKAFDGWFTSFAVYQLFRLRNEIGSVAPSPLIVKEVRNTLKSPIAALDPLERIMRIPLLLWPGTWTDEIKSGPFKGKSKAEKIIFELPVLSLYKQIQHVIDPTPLINYYRNDL